MIRKILATVVAVILCNVCAAANPIGDRESKSSRFVMERDVTSISTQSYVLNLPPYVPSDLGQDFLSEAFPDTQRLFTDDTFAHRWALQKETARRPVTIYFDAPPRLVPTYLR